MIKQSVTALMIALAGPALAQGMPAEVGAAMESMGLADLSWHPGPKQTDLSGRLPGGAAVQIDLRGSVVEEIETVDGGSFAAAVIAPVVPQALKASPDYPSDARFSKVEFETDEFELVGTQVDGTAFKAKYDASGRLLKWSTKE